MMLYPLHRISGKTLSRTVLRLGVAVVFCCAVWVQAQTLPSAPSFLNAAAGTVPLQPGSATSYDLFGRPLIPFTGAVRPARNWSVFVSARPQAGLDAGMQPSSGPSSRAANGPSLFSAPGATSAAPNFALRRDTVLFGTGFGGQNSNAFRFDLQPRSGLSLSTTASGIDFRLSSSYGSMYGEGGFGAAAAGGGNASFGASPFGGAQRGVGGASTAGPQLSLHLKF